MGSLDTYRALIPAHSEIPDATIDVYLGLAVQAHTASAWGNVYVEAMCFYAAHAIERTPGLGSLGAGETGTIQSQRDGDLSRTFFVTAGAGGQGDRDLSTTLYGQRYLELRSKLAATGPRVLPLRSY